MDEQLEFARQVAQRLAGAGIPYMMTGSMAQAVYAAPRMTRDVDFVVECTERDVDRLVRSGVPWTLISRRRSNSVVVAAPEDLILSKLIWAQESGSELQRRDAREIMESGTPLDWPYLERWAAHLSVSDLLHELRR